MDDAISRIARRQGPVNVYRCWPEPFAPTMAAKEARKAEREGRLHIEADGGVSWIEKDGRLRVIPAENGE